MFFPFVGVYMFETAILYPVDRDEGIGPQNVMGKSDGSLVPRLSATRH